VSGNFGKTGACSEGAANTVDDDDEEGFGAPPGGATAQSGNSPKVSWFSKGSGKSL
jgi:hypothetical protein